MSIDVSIISSQGKTDNTKVDAFGETIVANLKKSYQIKFTLD